MTQLDRSRMYPIYVIILCYLLSYTSSTIAKDDVHTNNTQLLWDSLVRGEISDNNTDSIHSADTVSVVGDVVINITTAYDEEITLIGDNDNTTASVELLDYDTNIECGTNEQFNGTFCEPLSDNAESLKEIIFDIFNARSERGNATQLVNDSLRKDNVSSVLLKIDQLSEMDELRTNEKILQRRDNDNVEVIFAKDLEKFTPLIRAVDGNEEKGRTVKTLGGSKQRRPGQTSLVIVFDGTGSMEHCLVQLRTGARLIVEKFANRDDNPIYNYIFVPFRDPRKYNLSATHLRRHAFSLFHMFVLNNI